MAENDKGKILRDRDVSLPRVEDFYYNDLAGVNFTKTTEDNIFYLEDPPEHADWVGFTADKALLSLKATKDAFRTSWPFLVTNAITGSEIGLDLDKLSWPNSSDITDVISAFKKRDAFDVYKTEVGADKDNNIPESQADLRLLFFNPPSIPSFTSASIEYNTGNEDLHIFPKKYSEVKDGNYLYCKMPYPYKVTEQKTEDGNIKATISANHPAYEDADYGYKDDDILYFIKEDSIYRQIIPLNRVVKGDKTERQYLRLNVDNSNPTMVVSGYKARDILVNTLQEAEDIRLVLDTNSMTAQNTSVYTQKYPLLYEKGLGPIDRLTNYVNSIRNSFFDDQWYASVGYNAYGLDAYKRIHGVIYVKVKNPVANEKDNKPGKEYVWWNLNKYIIYQLERDANSNSGNVGQRYHIGYGPTQLKPYTYDFLNNHYVDAFWDDALENDKKRIAAQKEIFKQNSDLLPGLDAENLEQLLYEWTVTLGDVTFFVPPESIRMVSQTSTDRMPLIRARGTVAKGHEKSQQFYEISVYFNEARGINGVAYEQATPNYNEQQKTGKKITYSMNGFRSLLAEMKFVPFVPIVNKTFNEVFNVYAVCFEALHVITVPGFPKLLKAVINLSKFNYQVYMPEVPGEGYKDGAMYYNPFSCCINYDTLRYYYQKPIILGDLLDMKLRDPDNPVTVNSYEFYSKTIFSNRTALLPCHFDDPTIRVYVANENRLMELDKIKKAEIARVMDPGNRYDAEGAVNPEYQSSNYKPNAAESRLIKDADIFIRNVSVTDIYAEMAKEAKALVAAIDKKENYGKFKIGQYSISVTENNKTIAYQGNDFSDTQRFMDTYFYEPFLKRLQEKTTSLKNSEGDKLITSVYRDVTQNLVVEFNTKQYIASARDFADTQREASAYIAKTNQATIDPDKLFADTCIHIALPQVSLSQEQTAHELPTSKMAAVLRELANSLSNGKIDSKVDTNQGLLFLDWCHSQGSIVAEANERTSDLKQSIDLETIHSLQYDLLIGTEMDNNNQTAAADKNALVKQFSATVGNTYARTSVSGIDGTAPQYMGGQDIHLSWVLETTNETIARLFKSLPELVSHYQRNYRHVLPTYPVKIDSDFTRMMGVTEITIDAVNVETEQNFPGLFRISVFATSVDRTLRNKEALKALDVQNKTLSLSRLLEYRQSVDVKNYEKLDAELCKAEIYPDLELPTMSELGQLGFRYIRYKDKERNADDFYVDPDFYFVYPSVTYGRVLLESLHYTFATQFPASDISQFLIDTSGAKCEIDGRTQLVKEGSGNEQAKTQEEDRKLIKARQAEDNPLYHLSGDNAMIFKVPFGAWNVGTNIRCSFLEPYYLQELQNANTGEMDSRIRINIDGKSEAEIKKAKDEADAQYAWIDLYSAKEKKVVSSSQNANFTVAQDKIRGHFKAIDDNAQSLKQWLANHAVSAEIIEVKPEQAAKEPLTQATVSSRAQALQYAAQQTASTRSGTVTRGTALRQAAEALQLEAQDASSRKAASNAMRKAVVQFFADQELIDILQKAFIVNETTAAKAYDYIARVIVSVADAKSGKTECTQKNKNSGDWMAYVSNILGEINNLDVTDPIHNDTFGIFGIRRYKEADFLRILPPSEHAEFKEKTKNDPTGTYYVLDPYYRYKSDEEKKKYLEQCLINYRFAAVSFARIVLWYLSILMENHIYPSIEYDVKRKQALSITAADLKARETINEAINENKYDEEADESQDETNQKIDLAVSSNTNQRGYVSSLLQEMRTFVSNNGLALDVGKFFIAAALAMLGEPFRQGTLYDLCKNRDYSQLNATSVTLVSGKYTKRNEADPTYLDRTPLLRKYLLALWGHEVLTGLSDVGKDMGRPPSSRYLTDYNTKLALAAASNPARYMRDSFYDMVRNDYRGRMLRAFPTFYMIFIDEGREIGLFKLHDNFYNINAIHEIQVVKSRTLPADTCTITMSNMFQTFTTNDEDCTVNYKGGLGDLWESFWHPQAAANRAELLRLAADKINRAKLQAGIRIHVRMGYGANARDLPVVFNGTIAEIQGNEMVKVIAQGDGVELCNPLFVQKDADLVKNDDIRFTMDSAVCGAPPKTILQSFLTAKGGVIAAMLRGRYTGDTLGYSFNEAKNLRQTLQDSAHKYEGTGIFNTDEWNIMVRETGDNFWGAANRVLLKCFPDNPYGLYHFGDPSYTDIFSQGEPAQNLYEITVSSEKISSKEVEDSVNLDAYYKDPNTSDTTKKTITSLDDIAYFGDRALDLNSDIDSGWGIANQKDRIPFISFQPFGKTLWEIMHICQSVAPDWMTGIRDFGFRSTIFLGKPHYYCAYKYIKTETGVWAEKRKPYQQWHMYNSSTDIIKNGITASSEKIKTNAVGIYSVEFGSNATKTDPIWVDQDIYPEYQRSMIVNTHYYGKSSAEHSTGSSVLRGTTTAIGATAGTVLFPGVGTAIGAALGWGVGKAVTALGGVVMNNMLDKHCSTMLDETGSTHSHEKIAFRMTVNALKDSMRQMYQGFMIVLGDPSVKPQDRIVVDDSYEDMEGMFEVREVIHQLSPHTGFTTTITPDLISAHEARCELAKQNGIGYYASNIAMASALTLKNIHYLSRMDELGKNRIFNILRELKQSEKTKETAEAISRLMVEIQKQGITKAEKTALYKKAVKYINDTKISTASIKELKNTAFWRLLRAPNIIKSCSKVLAVGAVHFVIAEIVLGSIQSYIYRTIRNSQTLTLFPMKKFGKMYAAGVDGSQGLIYGASSYNTVGPLEQLYARFFSGSAAKNAGGGEKFTTDVLSFLLDEDIQNEAAKYQRNTEFVRNALFDPYNLKESQLQSLHSPQIDKSVYLPKDAYALSLLPRAKLTKDEATQQLIKDTVINQTYVENIQDWITNANLKNLYYVPEYSMLERLFTTGFIRLVQDIVIEKSGYGLNDPKIQNYNYISAKGKAVLISAYKRKEEHNGKDVTVLDVPYLAHDALIVLQELCECIIKELLNKPDDNAIKQEAKDTYLILSSALNVGSKNYLYGSGYHFILTGVGKLAESGDKSLRNIAEKYRNMLIAKLRNKNADFEPCFEFDAKITGDGEIGVSVYPATPYGNTITKKDAAKKKEGTLIQYKGKTAVENKDPLLSVAEANEAENASNKETDHQLYERYIALDTKGRAVEGIALVDADKVKANKATVKSTIYRPSGYEPQTFAEIKRSDGTGQLYEISNLIGRGLAADTDKQENLFTATYQLSVEKEKYENKILNLLTSTGEPYHGTVLYKVKPIFEGTNRLASALRIEAVPYPSADSRHKESDTRLAKAAGLPFNVTLYNVQDKININYNTGIARKASS